MRQFKLTKIIKPYRFSILLDFIGAPWWKRLQLWYMFRTRLSIIEISDSECEEATELTRILDYIKTQPQYSPNLKYPIDNSFGYCSALFNCDYLKPSTGLYKQYYTGLIAHRKTDKITEHIVYRVRITIYFNKS